MRYLFIFLMFPLVFVLLSYQAYQYYANNNYTVYTTKYVRVGEAEFLTEFADTEEQKRQGLMFRKTIGDKQAMLFTFSSPQKVSFWMKNTLIPLDILFFDSNKKLQQIYYNANPCVSMSCAIYTSKNSDIQYVLEIKAGQANRLGIKLSDRLSSL